MEESKAEIIKWLESLRDAALSSNSKHKESRVKKMQQRIDLLKTQEN